MALQPLKKRHVLLRGCLTQVQSIDDVFLLLAGMRRGELPHHLVCPCYLEVGELESHLRCHWTHGSKEGVGRLKSCHAQQYRPLLVTDLYILVKRDILKQHAPPVHHLHVCETMQRT